MGMNFRLFHFIEVCILSHCIFGVFETCSWTSISVKEILVLSPGLDFGCQRVTVGINFKIKCLMDLRGGRYSLFLCVVTRF